MTKGIYGYDDIIKEEIVYIGKDSNIDKDKRHKQHMFPCNYNKQMINRVLQNNPERYRYARIYECPPHLDNVDLNGLEMQYIETLNPKFNFTKGGDGVSEGIKLSESHKQKIKENNSRYWQGKTRSDETKQKIRESLKGKKLCEEHKKKISKKINTSGYYRVHKHKNSKYKQGFFLTYRYYENGKRKTIASVDIEKLEEKVKSRGLPWIKFEKYREE